MIPNSHYHCVVQRVSFPTLRATSKSNLLNESYDQNRQDISTNSKTYFSQNYIVQSITIRVKLMVRFSKNLHCAIDSIKGEID